MSHSVKAWLSSIRRSLSSSSSDHNEECQHAVGDTPDHKTTTNASSSPPAACLLDSLSSDVLQYMLSFLHHSELHRIRLVSKEWNTLCDTAQRVLALHRRTPCEHIKYWMLKLRHLRVIEVSHNLHIDSQFLIWLKKEYLPLKMKEREHDGTASEYRAHKQLNPITILHADSERTTDEFVDLHLHLNMSYCFGIECVEEPQLYGRGGVNGHNVWLTKLINEYTPYGCSFNFYGNFRIINPSPTLEPRHVVELQLYSLKHDEVQHCFKHASMANRQFTGPLPRFERMIKNGYPIMIGWDQCHIIHDGVDAAQQQQQQPHTLSAVHPHDGYVSPLSSDDDEYVEHGTLKPSKQHFIVILHKLQKRETFKWTLSRQKLPPFAQCWMTDSVCPCHAN